MQTVKELRARAKELGVGIPRGAGKDAIAALVSEASKPKGRAARRAEAREDAGVKWAGYSRQTGSLIQVVNVADSTVKVGQPWASVCLDHGAVQGWPSYSKADHATAIPAEWCTGCGEASC